MSRTLKNARGPAKPIVAYPPPEGGQRDAAYHELRRLLILQQVPAGSRLTESGWARRLGVNRSALREAFVRLEAEGLVERGAKPGYIVPDLTLDDEYEVLVVRFSLESTAIELVCQTGRNTPAGLKRMQNACNLLEHLIDENYHLSTVEADRRFHESLIEAAANRRLAVAYRHAPLPLLHPYVTRGAAWAWRSRRTVEEHAAILKAILAGNVSQAKGLLRTHLFRSWQEDRRRPDGSRGAQVAGGEA